MLVSSDAGTERPWTVQPSGCGVAGSHVVLPLESLLGNVSSLSGALLGEQLVRLRYGVFAGVSEAAGVTSRQAAQCHGRSARQVILAHPDFLGPGAAATNFTSPSVLVTRRSAPRYVLLLENSVRMNSRGQWDFLRTAARDLVMRGLPAEAHLAVVLFNSAAHIAHPLTALGEAGKSRARQSLALQIKSKHALSPTSGSCVQCALGKAVESLGGGGGVLLLLSRATNLSSDLLPLLTKHRLRLFTVSLPEGGEAAVASRQLERLTHGSGGAAALVPVPGGARRPPLALYIGLVEAFRLMLQRTADFQDNLVGGAVDSAPLCLVGDM